MSTIDPETPVYIRATVIESKHDFAPVGSLWRQNTAPEGFDIFDSLAKRRKGARAFTRHSLDHFSHETTTSVGVIVREDYYRTKPADREEDQA